jgi:hypothetical protein
MAVVGKGNGRHAEFFGAVYYLIRFGEPVKQRIVTVNVEVDEFHVITENYSGRKR